MERQVEPEFLDMLPPDDPRAIRSRCDLRRVNFWMNNIGIMANALKEHFPCAPKQIIIELGAGDGNFLLCIAKKSNWQNVRAILLDRQKNVSTETLAAFPKLGWRAEILTADVFEWAQNESVAEIIIANLFLHHFENPKLAQLLQKISERAKFFVAIEPHRFRFAFSCAQMLRLIGCGKITRHDAEASIRAGFVRNEISELWPEKQNWQFTERRAGFFSHLFIAKRIE